MKAMIVGAGIGGLTAAIALRRAGVETTVFERAGELREVGAGLLLAANAVRALDELGLSEKVRRLGTLASAARILSWRGETLTDVPADELEKRLGTPSAAVHRADLQGLLLRELGEENVRLGATCSSFEQDEEGVTALVVDGSEERGDALIGADGLNSTIRTSLFGGEKPRYAGYTAWRAVVEPSHELLPWAGVRVVGERSEVRLRPHRRGQGLLVRHQKRSRRCEGRPRWQLIRTQGHLDEALRRLAPAGGGAYRGNRGERDPARRPLRPRAPGRTVGRRTRHAARRRRTSHDPEPGAGSVPGHRRRRGAGPVCTGR